MLKNGYSMKDILMKIGLGLLLCPAILFLIALFLLLGPLMFLFGYVVVLIWILLNY